MHDRHTFAGDVMYDFVADALMSQFQSFQEIEIGGFTTILYSKYVVYLMCMVEKPCLMGMRSWWLICKHALLVVCCARHTPCISSTSSEEIIW